MTDREPGFSLWLVLTESEARRIVLWGEYPERIQRDVQTMLADYDAHVKSCQDVIEKRTTKTRMRA